MLAYILVLLIAVAVGYGVYWLALHWGLSAEPSVPTDVGEWKGTEPAPAPPEYGSIPLHDEDDEPAAYLPIARGRLSWQSRMGGVLGLAVAVTVAAIASALSLYALGQMIAHLLKSASSG
jgi:hypothetical protein